eukprot:3661004-Rhodomonas_salina.2
MGELHLEVIRTKLERQFNVKCQVSTPTQLDLGFRVCRVRCRVKKESPLAPCNSLPKSPAPLIWTIQRRVLGPISFSVRVSCWVSWRKVLGADPI